MLTSLCICASTYMQIYLLNGNHMVSLYTCQCRKSVISKHVACALIRKYSCFPQKCLIFVTLWLIVNLCLQGVCYFCSFTVVSQLPCCTMFHESEKVVVTAFPSWMCYCSPLFFISLLTQLCCHEHLSNTAIHH